MNRLSIMSPSARAAASQSKQLQFTKPPLWGSLATHLITDDAFEKVHELDSVIVLGERFRCQRRIQKQQSLFVFVCRVSYFVKKKTTLYLLLSFTEFSPPPPPPPRWPLPAPAVRLALTGRCESVNKMPRRRIEDDPKP